METKEFFNTKVPQALANNSEDAKTIGAKFQFNITGAGEWHLDLTKTGPTCTQENKAADCTVTISDDNFKKLMENPNKHATSFFFSGKLKVAGNQMLGMKLSKIFDYVK